LFGDYTILLPFGGRLQFPVELSILKRILRLIVQVSIRLSSINNNFLLLGGSSRTSVDETLETSMNVHIISLTTKI